MIRFTTNLYNTLSEQLLAVSRSADNGLQRSERSCQLIQAALKELKAFILDYTFTDAAEEIRYFKEVKPQFLRERIYFSELYAIEAHLPVGGGDTARQYYNLFLDKVSQYFARHHVLYNYYRLGKTTYDDYFFLRSAHTDLLIDEELVEIDSRVCTANSYILSKLQAYERITEYLRKCLYQLDNLPVATDEKGKKFANSWTDSITALIELVYALHARGSINNGKGSIKQIITDFELIFNVEVGNFYRTFQNMRIRKKNATPFLDGLKNSYLQKVDEY